MDSRPFILIDCEQIVNKFAKVLRIIFWQFLTLILLYCLNSFNNRELLVWLLPWHKNIENDTDWPYIKGRNGLFLFKLLYWRIKSWHCFFLCCNKISVRLKEVPKSVIKYIYYFSIIFKSMLSGLRSRCTIFFKWIW